MTTGKTDQYGFSWKAFTSWDYGIGNFETANNTVMANVIKMRVRKFCKRTKAYRKRLQEAIAEYRVKMRQKFSIVRFLLRVFANIIIIGLLGVSIYLISSSVQRSAARDERQIKEPGYQQGFFAANEVLLSCERC